MKGLKIKLWDCRQCKWFDVEPIQVERCIQFWFVPPSSGTIMKGSTTYEVHVYSEDFPEITERAYEFSLIATWSRGNTCSVSGMINCALDARQFDNNIINANARLEEKIILQEVWEDD